jgi:hypothetical protein
MPATVWLNHQQQCALSQVKLKKAPESGAFRFRGTGTVHAVPGRPLVAQHVCHQCSETRLVRLLGLSLALFRGDHSLVPSIRSFLPCVAKEAAQLSVAAQHRLGFVGHAAIFPNPLF